MTAPRKAKKAAQPAAEQQPEAPRDELADRLIQAGLVANGYVLDLNGSLQVPHTMELPAPWNLPSRLFRFPVAVSRRAEDGSREIALRHPLLAGHPFVQQVTTLVGRPLAVAETHGFEGRRSGEWHHAVDLITAGHWRDLLETADFTTPSAIAGAVAYGLTYADRQGEKKGKGKLATSDAREIMRAIGSAEPFDRRASLRAFAKPSPCKQDSGKVHWPINCGRPKKANEAWGLIFGIEAGWFAYCRDGFLNWTETGRDRHAAGDRPVFVEASGQAAFAF